MNLTTLTTLALILTTTNPVWLQTNVAGQTHGSGANASTQSPNRSSAPPIIQAKTNRAISLNFRLPDWQTFHSHDAAEAQLTMETLQGIGCQVKRVEHDDHVDIRFRCPNWKPLKLDTPQQLAEWQSWLSEKGIDSVVISPGAKTALPTVSFRLTPARSAHIHDLARAEALEETFNMLGCEVATHAHNGHIDLAVECRDWITIGLTSETSAHAWQDWLKQNGFETRHTHKVSEASGKNPRR